MKLEWHCDVLDHCSHLAPELGNMQRWWQSGGRHEINRINVSCNRRAFHRILHPLHDPFVQTPCCKDSSFNRFYPLTYRHVRHDHLLQASEALRHYHYCIITGVSVNVWAISCTIQIHIRLSMARRFGAPTKAFRSHRRGEPQRQYLSRLCFLLSLSLSLSHDYDDFES